MSNGQMAGLLLVVLLVIVAVALLRRRRRGGRRFASNARVRTWSKSDKWSPWR